MSEVAIAYYATDRYGQWTVMVTRESHPRPGVSRSISERFIPAVSEHDAEGIANRLLTRGEVQLVRRLH